MRGEFAAGSGKFGTALARFAPHRRASKGLPSVSFSFRGGMTFHTDRNAVLIAWNP